MALPLASSSTSLSRYRISRIRGSSTSSTRTPQTTPVMRERFMFMAGASAKNVWKSTSSSSRLCSCSGDYPVSQQMIWSTSSLVRFFFSALVTQCGYTLATLVV